MFALAQSIQTFKGKHYLYALYFAGFSLFLFFVAGEEISWGQRIFGIESSEYLKTHNMQQETTVHNLKGLQEYQFVFYMAFSLLLSSAWFVINVLPKKLYQFLKPLVPSWFFSMYFIPIFVFYLSVNFLGNPHTEWQEFCEVLLAFGLLLFFVYTKKSLKRSK